MTGTERRVESLVRRIQLQKRPLSTHCSNPPHTLGSFLSSLFTESQDGSGWRGPLWLIWSHLPAQAHGTGLCAEGSGRSPVREAPQILWTICSVLSHCTGKEILPHVQVELLGISSCLFLLLHCWAPAAAVGISLFCTAPNHPPIAGFGTKPLHLGDTNCDPPTCISHVFFADH